MKIIWTKEAVDDLDTIYTFYLADSQPYAEHIYDKIVSDTEDLIRFPRLGSKELLLEDKPQSPRSLVVMRMFKIIYYIQNETIYIANIWDCRQNPESLRKKHL
ncbi:MAG: type II toxin-antitoxin system RelE/ParE family toxin [Tannerellaceae bacterium]|nr:type II toxin-antitoxin system RelE/ParE family toxin [Tannerellaceae bacterium]